MQNVTKVNYDELTLISKKLHDEGDDYIQLLSTTRQKIAALHSEWEGEAADKFFEDMENTLLPAIRRLSHGLIFSQETLNNIMKIISEADQETVSFFSNGADFGAGGFAAALGAGVIGLGASGADFGAGLFNQAGESSTPPATPGAGTVPSASSGEAGAAGQTGASTGPTAAQAAQEQTPPPPPPPTTPPTPASGSAAGGGGGGASSQGMQGGLDGMGSGLGGQPASSSSVGGSSGGAESLPDHAFGGGGSSGGGGLPSQGGGVSSGAGSGSPAGGDSGASGGGGVAAGVAGVVGSAAVGGVAKILKDKQDNSG